ncbi:MAG: hypothetical protein AAF682_12185 [Planctomycetota bacterium]
MKKLIIFLVAAFGCCFVASLMALIGIGFLAETHYIPDTEAHPGSELREADQAWLRENGIVLEGETVLWFYSTGFVSISEDGNLFTENAVISYWEEEGELIVQAAAFEDIAEIDPAWSDSWLEDSIFTVRTDGDEWFELYVSAENGKDKDFFRELTLRWQTARAATPTSGPR